MGEFIYDAVKAKAGSELVKDSWNQVGPMEALAKFAGDYADLLSNGEKEKFFYRLLGLRRIFPRLFLPPDLSLLAANVALGMEKDRVVLLDWELLPSAILLSMAGVKIALPDKSIPLPIETFYTVDGETSLGWDLEAHFANNPNFSATLGEQAVFFSTRDFLTSAKAADVRDNLIYNNLLDRVLRLPKPKRQNWNMYPILMILGKTEEPIHFAEISTTGPGPGGLDQEQCLKALWEKERKTEPSERVKTGVSLLRKIADVLRCQVARKKAKGSEPEENQILAREVSLADLNPVTGFVVEETKSLSTIDPEVVNDVSKYFLRKNDILMVFRGAESALGRVGLFNLEQSTIDTIPNRAFCVIRARMGINPVWLYYALQKPEITDEIRKSGSGADTLVVSLEAIRDLEISLPQPEQEMEIAEKYGEIIENAAKIKEIQDETERTITEIKRIA